MNTTGLTKPPHDIKLEEVVIASCLIDSSSIATLFENFKKNSEVFFDTKHQYIYKAMLDLYEQSVPVDLLTLSQRLKELSKLELLGGDYYLIQLTNKVSSSAHLDTHCKILIQYATKRKGIQVGNDLISKSNKDETDIFDLIDDLHSSVDDLSQWLNSKKDFNFKDSVDNFYKELDTKVEGIPSAIKTFKSLFNGYAKSQLYIVAGRPGMGKTSFVTSEALFMARNNNPIGIFSLEMTRGQIIGRILSNYASVNSTAIANKYFNVDEGKKLSKAKQDFSKLPIYINDQSPITPIEIKIQAKKWIREHDVKIIFIDYLQLMSSGRKFNNKEQEVSFISQSLKALSKELDIPVIALAQLSRAVENTESKIPKLSHLRDSGSIEQDADMVMFIFRPEYYNINEWSDSNESTQNQAMIKVAKNRHGKVGSVKVSVKLDYMRFSDLEYDSVPY